MAYHYKGNYDQALGGFHTAIQLNPDYAISYYYRGMMWLHLRELERAEADLIIAKEKGIEEHGIQLPPEIAAMLTLQ